MTRWDVLNSTQHPNTVLIRLPALDSQPLISVGDVDLSGNVGDTLLRNGEQLHVDLLNESPIVPRGAGHADGGRGLVHHLVLLGCIWWT